MTPEQLLPLAVTAFASLAAWGGLRHYGGKNYKSYAVPVAAAILIFGVDYVFDLPVWSYLIAILITPAIFHRSVKGRLEAAARKIKEVRSEAFDVRFVLADDVVGSHVAAWRIAPMEGSGAPAGLPLAKLEFKGEAEDEYQVVLWAPVKPFRYPVSLVIHHKDEKILGKELTGAPAVQVVGAQEWMIVRSQPFDFALVLFDPDALNLARAILALRSDEREMAIQVAAGVTRIISSGTFSRTELETLLEAFAAWCGRLGQALAAYRPPAEDL